MNDASPELQGISFRLDETGHKLLADIQPPGDQALPQSKDIETQLAVSGFAELHLHDDAIGKLLKSIRETDKAATIEIGERRDAEYLFEISDDGMSAWLDLIPAKGGKAPSLQDLDAAMQEAGITNGKLVDEMEKALADGHAEKLLIARGRPPVCGDDSRFEALYEESIERRPELDEKGRANYYSLGNIASVEPGDAVMRRHPPTEGKAGLTVRGEKISALPGENILYAANMEGVCIDDKDPDLLRASIAGHPVAFENGVNVDSLYTIDSVDLNTGNIDFDGSIKVIQDVCQGITIKAEGDIFIGGTVEAAILEAGGDIEITGGVIGHFDSQDEGSERQWTTRIQAGKSLRVHFAENARLQAGKKIIVAEVVTRCELHAEDSITVGTEGCKNGYILGGELFANHNIKAMVVGSQASIATHLHVGSRIADVLLEIDTLKKEITLKDALVEKLHELVRRLETGQMPDNGNLLEQAKGNIDAVKSAIAERDNNIEKLEVDLQELRKASIEISKKVFTNVYGYIGNEELRIGDEKSGGRFHLQADKVVFTPS